VAVHHLKPWRRGRPILLHGTVAAWDGQALVLGRRFRGVGMAYDGLSARKLPGDHGTLEVRRGGWVSRRRYLRRGGTLVGESFNIQTPARLCPPGAVRYVDLEVDVVYAPLAPRGRRPAVEVQDLEELARAVARGHLPAELARVARDVADALAARLQAALDAALAAGPLPGAAAGRPPGPPLLEVDWDVRPDPGALEAPAVAEFLARAARL
jgi:hypothetical protein